MLGNRSTSVTDDVVRLVVRLVLGTVLVAHGWQKARTNGGEATASAFDGMGVPAPKAAAAFATAAELGGGALLILGLLTPLAALAVVANMAGAWWFAHRGNGVLIAEGGWELVGVIAACALLLAALGAGRFSLDHLLVGRRRRTTADGHAAETAPATA